LHYASELHVSSYLELLDWRRRVAALFVDLRSRPADDITLQWFRGEKDALFKHHPQSPIPAAERQQFSGLPYWPFDASARVEATFTPLDGEPEIPQGASEVAFTRIGTLHFALYGQRCSLAAFWITGYAGGLFVPFKDSTSGTETYGGGRYMLDTI
jgi:uncharacterized protein (DUF1684 family)